LGASFETLAVPAWRKAIRFFRLDYKIFTYSVKKGFFRTPGLRCPRRGNASLGVRLVAAVCGRGEPFSGMGRSLRFRSRTTTSLSCPATRTCSGGAYTFQIPRLARGAGQRSDPD